jgi:hypothetical protein
MMRWIRSSANFSVLSAKKQVTGTRNPKRSSPAFRKLWSASVQAVEDRPFTVAVVCHHQAD